MVEGDAPGQAGDLPPSLQTFILQQTQATSFHALETIQSLWSGYGSIVRLALQGSPLQTVVLKHVSLPEKARHPRGWNTNISHQRKIQSYHNEMAWYREWAQHCDDTCRVPRTLGVMEAGGEFVLILEDLDAAGYDLRVETPTHPQVHACIRWLAFFHARFLGQSPTHLWPVGTYWHLATRPDEFAALNDSELKVFARRIDETLSRCEYQTLVHGDAKLANFCFSADDPAVAAVDFQYVGGGCGMKDLAYFISSCFDESDCERWAPELLDAYFMQLHAALKHLGIDTNFQALEREWRELYPVAWTDFYRFLKGWSPGHWKIHGYSERLARETIRNLAGDR